MKSISLSINPTYLCNFRCHFCYLTPEQLADNKKLDLKSLEVILKDLSDNDYVVEHVDLYGGEVGLLSEEYLYKLDSILENQGNPSINVVTNLYKNHKYFEEDHIDLSVSYDFSVREKHDQVLQNIIKSKKQISILMLASPELMKLDVDYLIKVFNQIGNIKTVEIKPYSTNQANEFSVSDRDFEEFVKKWLTSDIEKRFEFTNYISIKDTLAGHRNAFSSDHIYVTPRGKIGVLEFDSNDNEFFLEMDSIRQYEQWVDKEKMRVYANSFCSSCHYLGKCLTEHYRDVKSLDNSCNGYKNLLDWSKDHLS